MAKDAGGKAGDRERVVGTGSPERPVDPDTSGNGTLQPEPACALEGEEVPLRLVRVTKTRKGVVTVNKLTGETQLWEETQEYIPEEKA